ncbi:BTB/POZ domain-containing adapter for CUL3-mediated RhoA degradation protein 2-like [Amphibalanus amphitrite]|uniref:BTB/POZ domain-containing adapter for CUL3-mediated RhoA degradation protein 2-like n=1 Tax=Amphibalanus amphitrite TaxID=1232801 RepID=UPI001C92ABE4|nr:BTB/POZ domain-containing adapter for CUL3-mediated RhoA degradation protein 2-like [Amphibalanus amphitrite]
MEYLVLNYALLCFFLLLKTPYRAPNAISRLKWVLAGLCARCLSVTGCPVPPSAAGEACDSALKKLTDRDVQPICRIPLITSSREEHQLISQSTKPVVKLLINRHNNKYSYTSASDDNMLKNLEMFDKLSLRFSHRVLFIKDVTATNEICMWTFYGRGQKVAEVCCTSIVYATDKKHTKVECHEARIYEETLNIMLYEACDSPDAELMQATARRPAAAFGCTSDDDEPAAAAAGARSKHGLDRLRSNKQAAHAHAVPPPPAPPL